MEDFEKVDESQQEEIDNFTEEITRRIDNVNSGFELDFITKVESLEKEIDCNRE